MRGSSRPLLRKLGFRGKRCGAHAGLKECRSSGGAPWADRDAYDRVGSLHRSRNHEIALLTCAFIPQS